MSVLRPARPEAPSGRQFELTAGQQRAVIVEVGGGLREYAVDGQPVLDGYAADAMADGGRGQPAVILSDPTTGKSVTVWMDEHYKYVQLFSGDTLSPKRRRRGLAIEPMT